MRNMIKYVLWSNSISSFWKRTWYGRFPIKTIRTLCCLVFNDCCSLIDLIYVCHGTASWVCFIDCWHGGLISHTWRSTFIYPCAIHSQRHEWEKKCVLELDISQPLNNDFFPEFDGASFWKKILILGLRFFHLQEVLVKNSINYLYFIQHILFNILMINYENEWWRRI